MNATLRRSAQPHRFRSRLVIANTVSALVLPGAAQAHGAAPVIALDYEALPSAHGVVAPGIRAKVIDGDRKLELRVASGPVVTVIGYAGERFLRFSPRGVEVNERSLTAVTDKLTRPGSVPVLSAKAQPRWAVVTHRRRFAWHDHRLGPRPGGRVGAGFVGVWSIPVTVDGIPKRIRGQLWRARPPPLAPWLLLWGLAVICGCAVAWRVRSRSRRIGLYVCAALSGALVIVADAGFTLASAQSSAAKWFSLAIPATIALLAMVVFAWLADLRLIVAALCSFLAFLDAVADVPVFRHGYVVSELSAGVVRGAVGGALAAGSVALILVVAELLHADYGQERSGPKAKPRSQPKLAVPRGKVR